jgi:hypothetical protein
VKRGATIDCGAISICLTIFMHTDSTTIALVVQNVAVVAAVAAVAMVCQIIDFGAPTRKSRQSTVGWKAKYRRS